MLLVVVGRPPFAIYSEQVLHHDGVNGEENWTRFRKSKQNRLMGRSVAASFEERDAREEFGIAVNQTIA
jgi:hypothetical protein